MVGVVNQYRRREKDSTIITALNGNGGRGRERERERVGGRHIECMVIEREG